jgi:Fur family ferric uptake transcriptional regulator
MSTVTPAPSCEPPPAAEDIVADTVRRARAAGERWTTQRSVVVRVLADSQAHLSADAVLALVHRQDPRIGQATVYRTLNLLMALGVAGRLVFGGRSAKYGLLAGRPHHDHLIDCDTGEAIGFHDEELERLQQAIARRLGFDLVDLAS